MDWLCSIRELHCESPGKCRLGTRRTVRCKIIPEQLYLYSARLRQLDHHPAKRSEDLAIQWTLHTLTTAVQHMRVNHRGPDVLVP
jgi:hypothetical protein